MSASRRLSSSVIFPPEWDEEATEGDNHWWNECNFVDVSMTSIDALFLSQMLLRSIPTARLLSVQRFQQRRLWKNYSEYRNEIQLKSVDGLANEQLLFHGTGAMPAKSALAHPEGLDPRFSKGGFYGNGVYLAEDPAYQVGGRYAHRVKDSGGMRMQLVVVRAALGTVQEMGHRITADTRQMRMPGMRDEGPPRVLYDSVRAGPHRPAVSGPGESGTDASIVTLRVMLSSELSG